MKNVIPVTILFLIGFTLSGLGLASGIRDHQFKKKAGKTEGTVIELSKKWSTGSKSGSGKWLYAPVVTYSVGGNEYRKSYEVFTDQPDFQIGEKIVVYYEKGDPSNFELDGWINTTLPYFAVVLGAVSLFIAILILIFSRGSKSEAKES